MKKKMCKHWFKDWIKGKRINGYMPLSKNKGYCNSKVCPNNTDINCQIIPKRKPDFMEVKAWAFASLKKDAVCSATYKAPGKMCVPCKIVMTAANYKKIGGK